MDATFLIARNPDGDSSLPYLLRLPIGTGVILKTRETWPRANKVYCHADDTWPDDPEIVEAVAVRTCVRRGAAIDLVLDRKINNRSQFVFTQLKNRPAVFWQTAKTSAKTRPGYRVPVTTGARIEEILVDARERYPYRFTTHNVTTRRETLPVGDYGAGGAIVERKTLEDFVKCLVNATLNFEMAELAAQRRAAVVVEDRYSAVLKLRHVRPGFVLDLVARHQVRYPNVPIVFCESRKLAEEWTFRFLAAAVADEE